MKNIRIFTILFTFTATLFLFHPSQVLAMGQWKLTGPMNSSHGNMQLITLPNNKPFIISGVESAFTMTTLAEYYDLQNEQWIKAGNVNQGRSQYNPVLLNSGEILIAGGSPDQCGDCAIISSELYNPITSLWSFTGNLGTGRRGANYVKLQDGRVLAISGTTGDLTPISTSEIYDPVTGQWTYTGNVVNPVWGNGDQVVTLNDGRVLMIGSARFSSSTTSQLYDPATGQWSATGNLLLSRFAAVLAKLKDGRVLMIGGDQWSNVVGECEIYDPATGKWTQTGSLNYPRSNNRAVLLPDGRVFTAGGSDTTGTDVLPSEIFDPTTGQWTVDALLNVGHASTGMALPPNGQILIAGEWGSYGLLPTAEIYTPETTNISLAVPLLKQTASPWGSQEYDSAHVWSGLDGTTISRWGCAMTSAAMIFQYNGITKLPDGTPLTPGSLNSWLKSQPDGYVGNGLLNWLALSRLSKLSISMNNISSFDALEYQRVQGNNASQLTSDLTSSIPDILEEPGHFIVAKGINGNTFAINAPYYNRSTLQDGYANSFISLGKFVPSHTNLSYIMVMTDQDIDMKVVDAQGNQMGSQFTQQPLVDPSSPNFTSGAPFHIYYFQKPTTGTYKLITSSTKTKEYQITFYIYDKKGNVSPLQQNSFIDPTNPNTFTINFNVDTNKNSTTSKLVTFQSVIADIKKADNQKLINHVIAESLIGIVNAIQINKNNKFIAMKYLTAGLELLDRTRKIGMKEDAYQIITSDFLALKNLL